MEEVWTKISQCWVGERGHYAAQLLEEINKRIINVLRTGFINEPDCRFAESVFCFLLGFFCSFIFWWFLGMLGFDFFPHC